jgi:hypothetical protein
MKKTLPLLLLLFIPLISFGQLSFCDGWNAGYKKGLNSCNKNGTTPICPLPRIGADSYQDGYGSGYAKACNRDDSKAIKVEQWRPNIQLPKTQPMGAYNSGAVAEMPDFAASNEAIQRSYDNMAKNLGRLKANGGTLTARLISNDLISLNGKTLNTFKYIVIANINARKDKEIPKIKEVISKELSTTNFILVPNIADATEDLITNPNLALYLNLNSENLNLFYKKVILSLNDINGNLIHEREAIDDRTSSFLTKIVLQSIKNHPHKYDKNAIVKSNPKPVSSDNKKISKEEATKRLKEAKDLYDSGILTKIEYDKLIAKYKPIIMED